MSVMERDQKYIANTYARFPLVLTEGKGVRVKDENGKEYIDLGSGIAVNTFGYADEHWARAVSEQLTKLQHTSNLYYTEPAVALAQTLCERTGMKKVFFSNSGAEANECAIKTARKYFADKYEGKRKTIITLTNSFHGRTITTLAATGQAAFHQDFLPLTEGFVYADPTVESLKGQLNRGDIGAILFEVVQGEGGVLPLAQEFVDFMRDIAQKDDILLIADEVQIGNGRSGQLFGYMNFNLTPDIVSTAKGLGGGLPLGATLLGEKVKDVLGAGSHGSTFGGNPVCCAGALSVINRIDDDLLKEVREKSAYIIEELSNSKGVKSISGLGLMLGIETVPDASDVIKKCMDKGVLVIKAKHKVRLLPALNIPWEDLKTAVDIIKSVCVETA